MRFIPRIRENEQIEYGLRYSPATLLLGPRQVGKSTLARQFSIATENYFDLENPVHLSRLLPDYFGALASLEGVVVLDEVQQMPELLNLVRVLVDEPDCRSRFLLTGSSSPHLLETTAQSLAGRVRIIDLGGFSIAEVGAANWEDLWFRGGFPRSFLAESKEEHRSRLVQPAGHPSMFWLEDYLKTYVLRDIQVLAGARLSAQQLSRVLLMIAHYHGREWGRSRIASSLGINAKTIDRYMDLFLGTFLLRKLPPYIKNVGKRLRASPRYYFRDSGLLHCLLRIPNYGRLMQHDRLGPSWEGFCIEQVIRHLGCAEEDCYYWRTQAGAEIDLIIDRPKKPLGFEFKASQSPKLEKGSMVAMKDLELDHLYVLFPGAHRIELAEHATAIPIRQLPQLASELVQT